MNLHSERTGPPLQCFQSAACTEGSSAVESAPERPPAVCWSDSTSSFPASGCLSVCHIGTTCVEAATGQCFHNAFSQEHNLRLRLVGPGAGCMPAEARTSQPKEAKIASGRAWKTRLTNHPSRLPSLQSDTCSIAGPLTSHA